MAHKAQCRVCHSWVPVPSSDDGRWMPSHTVYVRPSGRGPRMACPGVGKKPLATRPA